MGTRYFEEAGPQNSEETLRLGMERALSLGSSRMVMATDSGKTARLALSMIPPGLALVVVTNPEGLSFPVKKLHVGWPAAKAYREGLEAAGVSTLSASLSEQEMAALRGLGAEVLRMDWKQFVGYAKTPLKALDLFSAGVRVALACTVAAYLAGSIGEGEVVAVAGTGFGGGGADSGVVIRVAAQWPQWRICELLSKPRVGPASEG